MSELRTEIYGEDTADLVTRFNNRLAEHPDKRLLRVESVYGKWWRLIFEKEEE